MSGFYVLSTFLVDAGGETPGRVAAVPAADGDLIINTNKDLSNKMLLKYQANSGAS